MDFDHPTYYASSRRGWFLFGNLDEEHLFEKFENNNEPTLDEGIWLSNKPASQSNSIAAPASVLDDDEGLHVRDTMIETSKIANTAKKNSKEMSKENPGYDPSALQTAVLQGQEIQDEAGNNENRLFIRPSRQDTETELRGWTFTYVQFMVNSTYAQTLLAGPQ